MLRLPTCSNCSARVMPTGEGECPNCGDTLPPDLDDPFPAENTNPTLGAEGLVPAKDEPEHAPEEEVASRGLVRRTISFALLVVVIACLSNVFFGHPPRGVIGWMMWGAPAMILQKLIIDPSVDSITVGMKRKDVKRHGTGSSQ